ncbi:SDR family NAD(P)-dependent oxidoreductase [Thermosynechococcaceae cyanobacterium Okahandja]
MSVLGNQVVLVVGATGGIGRAVVERLQQTGATLVLAARSRDRLQQFAATLSAETNVQLQPCDITQPDQVMALMQAIQEQQGRLDVLINAAGAGLLKPYAKITPTELDQMLDLNLKGCFYTSQQAAELMKEQQQGHICTVVGILGKHSMAMGAAYCAAKFGVVGFSKCMAEELKRYGIKFSLFYFGGVDTPFWDAVSLKVDRQKLLRPDTVAALIHAALETDRHAVPLELSLMPDSHVFF